MYNPTQVDTDGNGVGDACQYVSGVLTITVPLIARDTDPGTDRGDFSTDITVRVYHATMKMLLSEQTVVTNVSAIGTNRADDFLVSEPYTVIANADLYLAGALRNIVLTGADQSLTMEPLRIGDIAGVTNDWPGKVGDCVVNAVDMSEFLRQWSRLDPRVDLDANGNTGAEDYSIMRAYLGQECERS